MERERQEALEWFVQFANMDLSQLKPGDKAKLLVESQEYLFPTKEVDMFVASPKYSSLPISRSPADEVADMGIDMKMVTGEMVWAFEASPKIDSEQYWSKLLALQRWVKGSLYGFAKGSGLIKAWRVEILVEAYFGDKFEFIQLPITKSQEQYIDFKLSELMNGLPASTIQMCPGCKKYFLNTTLRKKKFCSPKCMWKVNADKRRAEIKKHPKEYKAYLKKQREIMRKKYEEKQKAELGPNVKVRRRKED